MTQTVRRTKAQRKEDTRTLVVDDVTKTLIEKLAEARAAAKKWSEISEYLRDEVNEKVDSIAATTGVDEVKTLVASSGEKLATVSEVIRKTLDQDKLKAEHPEIDFDNYQKVSASRQIRTA